MDVVRDEADSDQGAVVKGAADEVVAVAATSDTRPRPPLPDASSPPPSRKPDPWAHRRGEPRTFAAIWIAYLFLCALVSIGAAGSIGMVATDVYRASSRVLLVLVGVGVGVLWPMLRLSQEPAGRPLRACFNDVIVVAAPLQAVAWPQALPWMAAWPLDAVACLAASITVWVAMIGGMLAAIMPSLARTRAPRWAYMLLFVALSTAGPGVSLALGQPAAHVPPSANAWLMTSPIAAPWEVVRDRSWTGFAVQASDAHWLAVTIVGVAAVACWIAAARIASRSPE